MSSFVDIDLHLNRVSYILFVPSIVDISIGIEMNVKVAGPGVGVIEAVRPCQAGNFVHQQRGPRLTNQPLVSRGD